MERVKSKVYTDCLLYSKYQEYGNYINTAINLSERVDKESKEFEDVIYEIKHMKTTASIMKVLTSKNTVLIFPPKPMPKPFKVFIAADMKDSVKTLKAFIDCSNVLSKTEDGWKVHEDTLLSYLYNAEIAMVYRQLPDKIINNGRIRESSTICFAKLFTHIIDYIANISIIEYARDKCLYLSSRYYLENILRLDDDTTIHSIARKISGITEMKENTYDYILSKDPKNYPFTDLKKFVYFLAEEFKIDKLTLDLVVEKWMFLYGQGTVMGLEFFPAFSAMMTDAYCGAYINNQKTIEKILARDMVMYAKLVMFDLNII
jgi:hypothetical protein